MSKVLLLTLAWPSKKNSNLYRDLMLEFVYQGNEVHVLTPNERRFDSESTFEIDESGINVHRIATGNITKTRYFEKIMSLFLLNKKFSSAEKKMFSNNYFDIIIVTTPSVTFSSLVKKLKKRHKSFVYLLLKDIWPQGAVDFNIIRKNGIVWNLFRYYEKELYKISDKIGCMSEAGVNYLIKHNPYLKKTKIEINPNSLQKIRIENVDKGSLFERYNIPKDKLLFIYGGNISKSHDIFFLADCIKEIKHSELFFLIIGSGTHYDSLQSYISDKKINNISLLSRIPYYDYQELLSQADFGLIMLGRKYTTPQFPSKINDYLRLGKPIIAITNINTDAGKILEENGAGFNINSYSIDEFKSVVNKIIRNSDLYYQMSKNAIRLFNTNFTCEVSFNRIMNSYRDKETI